MFVLGALALTALAACGSSTVSSDEISTVAESVPGESAPDLAGTEWVLVFLAGHEMPDGEITLRVEDDPPYTKFDGNAVCNAYGGRNVATEEGVVEIDTFASSAVGCGSDGNRLERAYYDALREAATYRVRDGLLEMESGDGEKVLAYERWDREGTLPDSSGAEG